MEPTRTSLTRTWRPLPSSACDRPPAPGTGVSRWCVTHILCVAWACRGPASAPLLPDEPCWPGLRLLGLVGGERAQWWVWGGVGHGGRTDGDLLMGTF